MTIFDNDGFEESELEDNFSTVIYYSRIELALNREKNGT